MGSHHFTRASIFIACCALLALLAACAGPSQADRRAMPAGDIFLRLVATCGAPAPIPEQVLADPDFKITTVILEIKTAPPDRVRDVRVYRGSGLPGVDESVVRTVRGWQCSWLGIATDRDEWLKLPYALMRPGYTPIPPTYHKLWSGTHLNPEEVGAPEDPHDDFRARIISESNTVHGRVNRPFGLAFSLRTPDLPYQRVPYTYVWTLPEPGIVDPTTGKLSRVFVKSSFTPTNGATLLGWSVTEEEELLPGEYTLEIFVGGDRIAMEKFMMLPGKAP